MAEFLTSLSYVIASAAVCVTVSPFALLGLAPLCIMFVYVRRPGSGGDVAMEGASRDKRCATPACRYYTSSARELKRLESVSRTMS